MAGPNTPRLPGSSSRTAPNSTPRWPASLQLRDTPGTSNIDPSAHGSGFDRVGAFQDGYDHGMQKCKDYRDDDPVVVELPFNDAEDAARGGDAPYASIINGVPYDLEDYWTQVYPQLTGGDKWVPVRVGTVRSGQSRPRAAGAGRGLCPVLLCAR